MGKKAASKAEPPAAEKAPANTQETKAAAKPAPKTEAKAKAAPAKVAGAVPKQAAAPPPQQLPPKAGAAVPAKATVKASANSTSKAGGTAKAGAKASGAKAAPAKAPPPAEPEEDEEDDGDMEEVAKKKKKKKKKATDAEDEEPAPAPPPAKAAAKAGGKAASKAAGGAAASKAKAAPKAAPTQAELNEQSEKRAAAAADKDQEVLDVKKRLTAIQDHMKAKTGNPREWPAELTSIVEAIDRLVVSKRPPPAMSKLSSLVLEHHYQEMIAGGYNENEEFAQETKRHIESAKAAELYRQLRTRLNTMKTTAEDLLRSVGTAAKAEPTASSAQTKGKGKGEHDEEADSRREASAKSRLAKLHDKGEEDQNGTTVHTKTLELPADVMRYMFTPPHSFSRRFEDDHKCVIDAVRAPKGAGKGNKGERPPPKELIITGLTQEDVDTCAKKLQGLDFSGAQTRDLDKGMEKWARSPKDIENQFNVIVYKRGREFSIFGPKKQVEAAWANAEASKTAEETFVNGAVSMDQYMAQAMRLHLNSWGVETNSRINISDPSDGEVSVRIRAKDDAGLKAAKTKIQDFAKDRESLLVKGDLAKVKDSRMNRKYRELRDNFIVKVIEVEGGVQLVGPKDDLRQTKEELEKLFKMSAYEPVIVPVLAEQVQIFSKENTDHIKTKSGAEVRFSRGRGEIAESSLSLVGSDEEVAKAKEAIDELVRKEGTSAYIEVSEDTAQALLARTGRSGAKIMDLQHSLGLKRLRLDDGKVWAVGSEEAVAAAKKEIAKFSKQVELAQAETVEKVLTLSGMPDMRTLRQQYNVQAKWVDATYTLEIRGAEADVAKAEEFVQAAEASWVNNKPKPAETATVKKPKKAEEYKGCEDDFPSLGGGGDGKSEEKTTSTWGSKKKSDDTPKDESKEVAYPVLGAAATTRSAEPAEEEEADDAAAEADAPVEETAGQAEDEAEAAEEEAEAAEEEEADEAKAEAADEVQEAAAPPEQEAAEAEEADVEAEDKDDADVQDEVEEEKEDEAVEEAAVDAEEDPTPAPAPAAEPTPAPAPAAPARAADAKLAEPRKPAQPEFNMAEGDFPTLGGPAPATRGGGWGRRKA